MTKQTSRFLVTVADAVLRDPTTKAALAYGTAYINSGLTISTEQAEVRGGKNNPLLFKYIHSRKLDVTLTQATFDKTVIALNAGTTLLNSAVTVVATDCLETSSSGSATLEHTPLGNVTVFSGDTVQTVTPVGSVITVSGANSTRIDAVYEYTATVDQIPVETSTPPSVVDLTLLAEERDNTGSLINEVQINIPRFQVNGNYKLDLTANGVSNQALEGSALSTSSTDCTTGDYLAKVTWVPSSTADSISVYAIAATPGTMTFSVAAGLPASKQITLNGLRGWPNGILDLTTSASYAVTSGSTTLAAYFNVGANTGLVTAGSSVGAGWMATVTASYIDATAGLLNDVVSIIATA